MVAIDEEVSEKIVDGLTEYAQALGDLGAAKMGGALYRSVAPALRAAITRDDSCRLAFPTILIRPDLRAGCLVVVLGDRIVLAWKAGMFRKPASQTVPIDAGTEVRRQSGTGASLRGAQLLVISGSPGATVALPVDKPDAAAAVFIAAVKAAQSSGPDER